MLCLLLWWRAHGAVHALVVILETASRAIMMHRWQPGMTVLDVEDWDTGKSVTIPVETG